MTGYFHILAALATLANSNLAFVSLDDTIKIWNPNTVKLAYTLKGHTNIVTSLVTLSNGNLAFGSWDDTIKIWDSNTIH